MITATDTKTYQYAGLSTDTKPVDCSNGSVLIEEDTVKVFIFDEENHIWREL